MRYRVSLENAQARAFSALLGAAQGPFHRRRTRASSRRAARRWRPRGTRPSLRAFDPGRPGSLLLPQCRARDGADDDRRYEGARAQPRGLLSIAARRTVPTADRDTGAGRSEEGTSQARLSWRLRWTYKSAGAANGGALSRPSPRRVAPSRSPSS